MYYIHAIDKTLYPYYWYNIYNMATIHCRDSGILEVSWIIRKMLAGDDIFLRCADTDITGDFHIG